MKGFEVLSAAEQVAERLREELLRGTWVDLMPGEDRLMARLCVGRNTIREALILLEKDGYLQSQGTGKMRRITLPEKSPSPSLQVGLLLHDSSDRMLYANNLLRQHLMDAGHQVAIASNTLSDLKMDAKRVAAYAARQEVDAWVVRSATHDVLEALLARATPVFSFYGSFTDLPIAGVTARKVPKVLELLQQLIDMGHRRIVNITRTERLMPKMGAFEQSFIGKLHENGIATSDFNLPMWGPEPNDLHRCLDKIFAFTPPTAIYISEQKIFNAVQQHLAHRGIVAPRDVSLICGEPHINFPWLETPVTHYSWNEDRIVQCIMRWIAQTARGKRSTTQTQVGVKLVQGGTIGPPPK